MQVLPVLSVLLCFVPSPLLLPSLWPLGMKLVSYSVNEDILHWASSNDAWTLNLNRHLWKNSLTSCINEKDPWKNDKHFYIFLGSLKTTKSIRYRALRSLRYIVSMWWVDRECNTGDTMLSTHREKSVSICALWFLWSHFLFSQISHASMPGKRFFLYVNQHPHIPLSLSSR